jgi:hypothetical protein
MLPPMLGPAENVGVDGNADANSDVVATGDIGAAGMSAGAGAGGVVVV